MKTSGGGQRTTTLLSCCARGEGTSTSAASCSPQYLPHLCQRVTGVPTTAHPRCSGCSTLVGGCALPTRRSPLLRPAVQTLTRTSTTDLSCACDAQAGPTAAAQLVAPYNSDACQQQARASVGGCESRQLAPRNSSPGHSAGTSTAHGCSLALSGAKNALHRGSVATDGARSDAACTP